MDHKKMITILKNEYDSWLYDSRNMDDYEFAYGYIPEFLVSELDPLNIEFAKFEKETNKHKGLKRFKDSNFSRFYRDLIEGIRKTEKAKREVSESESSEFEIVKLFEVDELLIAESVYFNIYLNNKIQYLECDYDEKKQFLLNELESIVCFINEDGDFFFEHLYKNKKNKNLISLKIKRDDLITYDERDYSLFSRKSEVNKIISSMDFGIVERISGNVKKGIYNEKDYHLFDVRDIERNLYEKDRITESILNEDRLKSTLIEAWKTMIADYEDPLSLIVSRFAYSFNNANFSFEELPEDFIKLLAKERNNLQEISKNAVIRYFPDYEKKYINENINQDVNNTIKTKRRM